MTEQVPDLEEKPVQDVLPRPILLERLAVVLAIWGIVGFGVFANHQTDACPPDVEHREAIRAALWAPVVLADGASQLVRSVSLRPVVGLSFLACWVLLVLLVLRSRTRKALYLRGITLAFMCSAGLWCVSYMRTHPVG